MGDEPKVRKKPGPKVFVPTPEQRTMVKQLVAFGLTQPQICQFLKRPNGKPISQDLLAHHFRRELDDGLPEANAQVARRLFQVAMEGNLGAMIFWLKTRARWHEVPQDFRVLGADGQPVSAGVLMVPAPVDPNQWAESVQKYHESMLEEKPPAIEVTPVERNGAS